MVQKINCYFWKIMNCGWNFHLLYLSWFQVKNDEASKNKCLHLLTKAFFVFVTVSIYIAYFYAISRDSNLNAAPMKLEIKCASNTSIFGKFFCPIYFNNSQNCIVNSHLHNNLYSRFYGRKPFSTTWHYFQPSLLTK